MSQILKFICFLWLIPLLSSCQSNDIGNNTENLNQQAFEALLEKAENAFNDKDWEDAFDYYQKSNDFIGVDYPETKYPMFYPNRQLIAGFHCIEALLDDEELNKAMAFFDKVIKIEEVQHTNDFDSLMQILGSKIERFENKTVNYEFWSAVYFVMTRFRCDYYWARNGYMKWLGALPDTSKFEKIRLGAFSEQFPLEELIKRGPYYPHSDERQYSDIDKAYSEATGAVRSLGIYYLARKNYPAAWFYLNLTDTFQIPFTDTNQYQEDLQHRLYDWSCYFKGTNQPEAAFLYLLPGILGAYDCGSSEPLIKQANELFEKYVEPNRRESYGKQLADRLVIKNCGIYLKYRQNYIPMTAGYASLLPPKIKDKNEKVQLTYLKNWFATNPWLVKFKL